MGRLAADLENTVGLAVDRAAGVALMTGQLLTVSTGLDEVVDPGDVPVLPERNPGDVPASTCLWTAASAAVSAMENQSTTTESPVCSRHRKSACADG